MGISGEYLGHIWGISPLGAYIANDDNGDILEISLGYLGGILKICLGYLGGISALSRESWELILAQPF